MLHTVYQTTNILNDVFYVGKHNTINPHDSYLGSGKHLKNAINKYGKENFHKSILFIFDTEQEAFEKEFEIIQENILMGYGTYNIASGGAGGGGMLGRRHSEETKDQQSQSAKGNTNGRGNKGNPRSEETKQKLREANLGKKASKETKLKQSISLKDREFSLETRSRISKSNSNVWQLTSSEGEVFVTSSLRDFCKEHKLSYGMLTIHYDGKKIQANKCQKSEIARNTVGWSALILKRKRTKVAVNKIENRKNWIKRTTYIWTLTSPTDEVFVVFGQKALKAFCQEQQISMENIINFVNKGVVNFNPKGKFPFTRNTLGWKSERKLGNVKKITS